VTAVRRATPEDARAIAEVHVATWRATYVGIIPQEILDALDVDAREADWATWVRAGDSVTFVAEDGGRVVGFASAGPCRGFEDLGELYAIYVLPRFWGTGAGSSLMAAAVEWLAARWSAAALWVAEENPRARRFYERRGWLPDDHRVEEVAPGAPVAEVRYHRAGLGPG
jgi:GNAT superfamily N-acetyltransferase